LGRGEAKGLRYLERRKATNSISRTATNKWKTLSHSSRPMLDGGSPADFLGRLSNSMHNWIVDPELL
jgi:hypothetical protein